MANRKLFISVPVVPNGGIESHLVQWMLELEGKHTTFEGWDIVCSICRDRPVVSTRNRLVKKFLETDCDVLMTIDDDQIPYLGHKDRTGGLHHLLRAIEKPEVDCVNVITLRVTDDGPLPVINKLTGPLSAELYVDILNRPKGLHELKGGAMGGAGIMVERHVLEKFQEEKIPWFWDVFAEEQGRYADEFSGKDLWGERLVGHDTWFFKKCHELGFRCWVDTRCFWGHVKPSDLRAEFRREMDFMQRLENSRVTMSAVAAELVKRYGNENHVAPPEFIVRMVEEVSVLSPDDMVVECGSGLTSRILCRLLRKERLVILEDDPEWFADLAPDINGALKNAPLVDCGEYDWYQLPALPAHRKVGLVVCDGPHEGSRGGRYGALPQLQPYLADRYVVLLDDTHRLSERQTLEQWEKEFGIKTRHYDAWNGRAYAVLEGRK